MAGLFAPAPGASICSPSSLGVLRSPSTGSCVASGLRGSALAVPASALDPLSPEINSFLAWDYYLERDYASCLATSRKAM
jgi:hypothetical protein